LCIPEGQSINTPGLHLRGVQGKAILTNLTRFIHILRQLEVKVSSAEAVDAVKALARIDLSSKEQVKTGLRAVLAKNATDRHIFNLAFEVFFVTGDQKRERRRKFRQAAGNGRSAGDGEKCCELEEEIGASLPAENWSSDFKDNFHLTREEKETYFKLSRREKKRLQEFMKSHRGNPVNNPNELIARAIKASLNFWRYQMMKQEAEKERGKAVDAQLTGVEELDEVIEEVARIFNCEVEEQLIYRDMKDIADRDLPKMTAAVKKLAGRLATRISRRYRQSKRKKVIDIRRSIRGNIQYGGIPLELRYRVKKIQKPRILLICDVSASMAQYSRFVMEFIYAMSAVVDDIESFTFAEDLERVTESFGQQEGFARIMTEMIAKSEQWGKATNFNTALKTFFKNYFHLLTPTTLVIVVSDAKTLAASEAAQKLHEMRRRVRQILWLNTLPAKQWEHFRPVKELKRHCCMCECRTLVGLEKALRNAFL